MSFPFSFRSSVPGLPNPFAAQQSPAVNSLIHQRDLSVKVPRHRPSPAPSSPLLPAPRPSRKRGWAPSTAEPSLSATTLTSSQGYLDTPAKYREMASMGEQDDQHEVEEMVGELPPAKRRRTSLAGSIVSTAVSAALIGTAVGLTVYRLWRDRGKEPEAENLPPPPAYELGEWVPAPSQPPTAQVTAPTPHPSPRKSRQLAVSSKRAAGRSRRTRARHSPPRDVASPGHKFDFGTSDQEDAVEDQMDWIGGKLATLIEEGRKALGKEVVVMSEAQEDEVDDGTGAWEEEEQGKKNRSGLPISRAARSRSGSIAVPSPSMSYSYSSPSSPGLRRGLEVPSSSFSHSQSYSPGSSLHAQFAHGNGEGSNRMDGVDDGVSPEVRDYMEKARARYRGRV